ncbi:MAG TPA: ZIP family metal transporter [Pseudolysinimonas sp.]|jgi:ZIP family zinc transporter
MNPSVLLFGFLAGATILLGLPIGRLRTPSPRLRILLSAGAVGVLLFLVWDVLNHAWGPIDSDLTRTSLPASVWILVALFLLGLVVGLLGVALFEMRWLRRSGADELPPRRLALLIAIGIGLHNLAEGLAIGQSASSGELALAAVLVVGFALHNATEGFGIVSPLAGQPDRPSWPFLLLLGLIGGGPTFVGTIVGSLYVSEELSVLFLALAAGSIVYVLIQLLSVLGRARRTDLAAGGILVGLVAGFATDAILTAGGV